MSDFSEIERRHDQPPDEPHPRRADEPGDCPACGSAATCWEDLDFGGVIGRECHDCGHRW